MRVSKLSRGGSNLSGGGSAPSCHPLAPPLVRKEAKTNIDKIFFEISTHFILMEFKQQK
jgi:hypothetical protein